MGEWQPIETAPKDGTPLDLWIGRRVADCFWSQMYTMQPDGSSKPDDDPYSSGWVCRHDSRGQDGFPWPGYKSATHWMAIPGAPEKVTA